MPCINCGLLCQLNTGIGLLSSSTPWGERKAIISDRKASSFLLTHESERRKARACDNWLSEDSVQKIFNLLGPSLSFFCSHVAAEPTSGGLLK